jgi:hypothetical protein
MKRQALITLLTTSFLALGVTAVRAETNDKNTTANITCNSDAIAPTVVATVTEQNRSQKVEFLTFPKKYFSSKSAIEQCQSAAKTLQTLYSSDRMNYLASDLLNGKPTVCAVERRGLGCDSANAQVLFAFDRTVDPSQALYDMLGDNFKQSERPDTRTVSRIYTDLRPRRWWMLF